MAMRRRDFLKSAGGASVSAGLFGAASTAAAIADSSTPDKAFGFADDKVPMNAANLCPMPTAIRDAVARYAASLDVDMSGPNRKRIEAHKSDARAGIARQLGVSASEIAIVRNTSEANNIVVQGMSLDPGAEVLLWDQNHPSNKVAWQVRADRTGCQVRYFDVPIDAGSIDEVIDHVAGNVRPETRVLSFTHISNITGFRLPAAEIIEAVRRRHPDIHIHVDGAQTWGFADANLRDLDCDSFTGSAHKWYMGPREVGMLFVRESRQGAIWPGVVSVPWGNDLEPSVDGAQRFEALGQRDDAAIAALVESIAFHDRMTPAGIEQLSLSITDQLRDALIDIDVPFVSSKKPAFKSSIIILKAPQDNRSTLIANVLRDAGVILAGVNGLRLSPHIYNTPDHVQRVAAAINASRDLLG